MKMDRRTVSCGIAMAVAAAASGSLSAGHSRPTKWPDLTVVNRLPGDDNESALTIDDGVSVAVVGVRRLLPRQRDRVDVLRQRRQQFLVSRRTRTAADGRFWLNPMETNWSHPTSTASARLRSPTSIR